MATIKEIEDLVREYGGPHNNLAVGDTVVCDNEDDTGVYLQKGKVTQIAHGKVSIQQERRYYLDGSEESDTELERVNESYFSKSILDHWDAWQDVAARITKSEDPGSENEN